MFSIILPNFVSINTLNPTRYSKSRLSFQHADGILWEYHLNPWLTMHWVYISQGWRCLAVSDSHLRLLSPSTILSRWNTSHLCASTILSRWDISYLCAQASRSFSTLFPILRLLQIVTYKYFFSILCTSRSPIIDISKFKIGVLATFSIK